MTVRREGDRLTVAWYARSDASSSPAAYQCVNGPTSVPRLGRLYRNQVPLVIGNTVDLRANPCVLEFDEVRIYNRALTPTELP
jgi:hypothetical protein